MMVVEKGMVGSMGGRKCIIEGFRKKIDNDEGVEGKLETNYQARVLHKRKHFIIYRVNYLRCNF